MPCFMVGYGLLLFRSDDHGLALKTSYDPVHCIEEILSVDHFLVPAGCSKCGFVANIRYVRT